MPPLLLFAEATPLRILAYSTIRICCFPGFLQSPTKSSSIPGAVVCWGPKARLLYRHVQNACNVPIKNEDALRSLVQSIACEGNLFLLQRVNVPYKVYQAISLALI